LREYPILDAAYDNGRAFGCEATIVELSGDMFALGSFPYEDPDPDMAKH
jgi:hypothetical protein